MAGRPAHALLLAAALSCAPGISSAAPGRPRLQQSGLEIVASKDPRAGPSVVLKNAASPGCMPMPVLGLGTGGYARVKQPTPGGYPQCWADSTGLPYGGTVDCGETAIEATKNFLDMGGRRIDNADVISPCLRPRPCAGHDSYRHRHHTTTHTPEPPHRGA